MKGIVPIVPIVSVIIPVYNGARYIGEAMASIQAQSFQDWELIVVNDGSTDETATIVEAYARQDQRLRVIHQSNHGTDHARCRGFNEAKGAYLYFLDADDTSNPTTLQRLVEALERHREAVAAYGIFEAVNEQGAILYHGESVGKVDTPLLILPELLQRCFLGVSAVMIRRAFLTPADFLCGFNLTQDYWMWCRTAAKGLFVPIGGGPLYRYRCHTENTTHQNFLHASCYDETLAAIFSDPAIVRQVDPAWLQAYRKTHEFFISYWLLKSALRQRQSQMASYYLWHGLQAFISGLKACWCIARIVARKFMQKYLGRKMTPVKLSLAIKNESA